jgi:hypothetical protein
MGRHLLALAGWSDRLGWFRSSLLLLFLLLVTTFLLLVILLCGGWSGLGRRSFLGRRRGTLLGSSLSLLLGL